MCGQFSRGSTGLAAGAATFASLLVDGVGPAGFAGLVGFVGKGAGSNPGSVLISTGSTFIAGCPEEAEGVLPFSILATLALRSWVVCYSAVSCISRHWPRKPHPTYFQYFACKIYEMKNLATALNASLHGLRQSLLLLLPQDRQRGVHFLRSLSQLVATGRRLCDRFGGAAGCHRLRKITVYTVVYRASTRLWLKILP